MSSGFATLYIASSNANHDSSKNFKQAQTSDYL